MDGADLGPQPAKRSTRKLAKPARATHVTQMPENAARLGTTVAEKQLSAISSRLEVAISDRRAEPRL